jgi:hypothetical protein
MSTIQLWPLVRMLHIEPNMCHLCHPCAQQPNFCQLEPLFPYVLCFWAWPVDFAVHLQVSGAGAEEQAVVAGGLVVQGQTVSLSGNFSQLCKQHGSSIIVSC